MLEKLGAQSIRLLTNNPEKIRELKHFAVNTTEPVPHQTPHI